MADPILRPATPDDVDAIAAVFHEGWHDVHPGRVPDGLTERRTPEAFHERVTQRVAETDETTVAEVDGTVAGFVMVHEDEAEQVYVDRAFRGSGVAALLLTEAERQIAAAGTTSPGWWSCAATTAPRRSTPSRAGLDEGDYDYPVTALGEHFISPCRRFTKRVG